MVLEDEVLDAVRPTPEERERVWAVAQALLQELARRAKAANIPATPLLVGSVDKDTFLREPEIDAFVAFPPDTPREDLQRWGLELGQVLEAPERRYAEHPYTRGRFRGVEAEVVPCYALDRPTDRMTAVDRTPFHSTYVKERMDPAQRDEVRLLKQFAEGIGIYGAEARVQGFSGYLCELLILRYGSLREVLEAAARWRPPVRLELDREATRKFPEPLAFVDPVDGRRNAASAVSGESLATFILAAKEYLRQPRRSFFFPALPPTSSPEDLVAAMGDRRTAILGVASAAPDLTEDVVWPQLRKAQQAVVAHLQELEFRVLKTHPFLEGPEWVLLLELEAGELPPVRRHQGPPTWMGQAQDFLAKWEAAPERVAGPYVEGDRLLVDLRREVTRGAEALERGLPPLSLGRNLDEGVRRGYRVLEGEELARAHPGPLAAFLFRRLPWAPSPG